MSFKKTTWDDVAKNKCRKKPFMILKKYSGHGTTKLKVECPFCECINILYLWSLAGSGIRCKECGAMFGNDRAAYKFVKR